MCVPIPLDMVHRLAKQIERAGGIRLLASEPAEDAATTKLVRDLGLRVSFYRMYESCELRPTAFDCCRSSSNTGAHQTRARRLRRSPLSRQEAGVLRYAAIIVAAICG